MPRVHPRAEPFDAGSGRIAASCGRVILPGLLAEAESLELVIRRLAPCVSKTFRPMLSRCLRATGVREFASRGSVLPEIACL
jgi:hypothetical protein